MRLMIAFAMILLCPVLLSPPALAKGCKVGSKAKVEWKGYYWQATLKSISNDKYCVHYDGWEKSWDECVSGDRFQCKKGKMVFTAKAKKVQVEWKSDYYPAKVNSIKGSKYCVHYLGHEKKWDECVGPERVRQQTPKGVCHTVGSITQKVWKVAGKKAMKLLNGAGPNGVLAAKVLNYVDKGIKFWNKIVGMSSSGKIGPRRMKYNKWQNGTVVAQRAVVSPVPALGAVKMEFHKVSGSGEMTVTVCARKKNGLPEKHSAFTIAAGTPNGKVKTINLKKARNKVVSVIMNQIKAGKNVKWKMKATMKGR